jgi:hypothetical protein
MYLLDHPTAIQTPPNFFDRVSITIWQQFEKMEKKEQYFKARKSERLTVLVRFSGLSI